MFTGFEVGLVRVRFVVDTMTGMSSSTNSSVYGEVNSVKNKIINTWLNDRAY